jgi:superfamily II DNA or RNA helicase
MQYDLIEHEANYSLATFPEPRPFQDTAHEKLRQGAREGNRCQMIMSPTGSGKTYLAMRIIHEALLKGKRAMFVCDRTTLINQTSEVADSYGLGAHSVIQAGHWRYDLRQPFQIASIQTLARRAWPESDVIVIDEAHSQYKAWVDHIQDSKSFVIALSATPFSKGLGRLFTNLINAATMHELTQSGVLVPMRVYSCTKINMRGAE